MLKVLIACEESQTSCKAFRALGHEAYSADIQDCSGGHPEWHVKGDCLPLLDGSVTFKTQDGVEHVIDGKWDLIIAHPPCTYLSVMGANWLYRGGVVDQDRLQKGFEAKEFFMRCYNANCDHVALENPVQLKVFEMPKFTQMIQPWMFGEMWKKQTRLWIRGLPNLVPSVEKEPEGVVPWVNGGNLDGHGNPRKNKGRHRNQTRRSKTFDKVAEAMANQWGNYLQGLKNSDTILNGHGEDNGK